VIWLNPAALIALALVSAPILIHILVQRRAERFAFPTLRFLRPTRLAAIRRHVLEDVLLLVVRAAILAAAVAALAGPLMVTPARRQMWQQRIVRATVVDTSVPDGTRTFALNGARAFPAFAGETAGPAAARLAEAPEARRRQASDQPFRSQTFATPSLADGTRRAVAWLETAPPARRELAIVSPFAIGSLTPADLAGVPADVGVRLERSGSLPPTGTIPFGRVLTINGPLDREVTLAGPATAVRDVSPSAAAPEPSPWPIEVLASPAAQSTADAAVAAVLAQRVWAPAPDRRAQLVLLDAGGFPMNPDVAPAVMSAVSTAGPVRVAWMAEAIARIMRDADLQAAARRVASGVSDARFTATPWQLVADASNGEPLVCVSQWWNARLVRRLFDGSRTRAKCEVGEPQHDHRVHDDKAEEEQDWEVRVEHESPNFVKTFTKSSGGKLSILRRRVNGETGSRVEG